MLDGMRRLSMDIVASIVAYLTCVAGIIGAVAISLAVLFAAPDRSTLPQDAAAPITLAVKHGPPPSNVATQNAPRAAVEQNRAVAVVKNMSATKKRSRSPQTAAMQPAPTQLRHAMRPERNGHVAYQQDPLVRQDPDFATRFLGYAE